MNVISWTCVAKDLQIPAKPNGTGIWTKALDFVKGPVIIKIEATGKWKYADEDESKCGPDGHPASYITPSMCISSKAPVGALIGKIGGGTTQGDKPEKEDDPSFAVGSFAVFEVSSGKCGALFLTINDLQTGYVDNADNLNVQIYKGNTSNAKE